MSKIACTNMGKVRTDEEAHVDLEAFHAELGEMFIRYGLHGLVVLPCVITATGEHPDARAYGMLQGCSPHTLAFLARFMANTLPKDNIALFSTVMHSEIQARLFAEALKLAAEANEPPPVAQPEPEMDPEVKKLLEMPLPGGKKWQN